jgi:hypothetical protein
MNNSNPCIVSFFMDNVDRKTVDLQQQVIAKYNKSKVPVYAIKINVPHAVGIDYFWAMNGVKTSLFAPHNVEQTLDHDSVLILDIDCIPLHEDSIDYYLNAAAEGKVIGNAQRSNHIDNGQHMFAAPSAAAISKQTFIDIGSPSAIPTERSDVMEEYTWEAENLGKKVDLIMPLRYDSSPLRFSWEKEQPPYWALAEGYPPYGVGTTFGTESKELFWHSFQIFHPGQQERFWAKCESLLNS